MLPTMTSLTYSRTAGGAWCVMMVALVLMGCGDHGPTRLQVDGFVTFDGQPIDGHIVFQPLDKGCSAGGAIEQGQYLIERANGPNPGKYRVELVSYRPTGWKIPADDIPGQLAEERKQIIPKRYNVDSSLTVDLQPGNTDHLDFVLKSR